MGFATVVIAVFLAALPYQAETPAQGACVLLNDELVAFQFGHQRPGPISQANLLRLREAITALWPDLKVHVQILAMQYPGADDILVDGEYIEPQFRLLISEGVFVLSNDGLRALLGHEFAHIEMQFENHSESDADQRAAELVSVDAILEVLQESRDGFFAFSEKYAALIDQCQSGEFEEKLQEKFDSLDARIAALIEGS